MLTKCLGTLFLLASVQAPAQAQQQPVDRSCLNSAVLSLVDVGSPQQKILLSFKLKNGKPQSPKIEQSSGQHEVDQLAQFRLENCSFSQAGTAQDQPIRVAMAVDESVFAPDKVQALYASLRTAMLNEREYHVYVIETASEEAAQKALAQLASGDFEVVASKTSMAKSARYGGNLGWRTSGSFAEPLAKVLEQGKWPAQYSQPINVKDRWYVLSVSEERPAQIPKLEDVSDRLRRSLLIKRAQAAVQP